MRKLTFFTLLIALSFDVLSQADAVFFSEQGEKFTVVLNGVQQNTEPQTNVKITDLTADYYKVKIMFLGNLPDIDKNLVLKDGIQSTFTIIQNRRGKYKLRYMSEVAIDKAPEASEEQEQSVMTYSTKPPSERTTVTTSTTETTVQENGDGANVGINVNAPGVNMDIKVNDNMSGTSQSSTTTTTTTTTTTSSSSVNVKEETATQENPAAQASDAGCNFPMSSSDFKSAKESVSEKDFEDTKLTVSKQIADKNCFSSEQVKSMLGAFDFEDTKLEFAKYAYDRTTDKNNYYKVNDAFDFDSSVDELNQHIQQK